MKRNEFKTLIKRVIKEVINESEGFGQSLDMPELTDFQYAQYLKNKKASPAKRGRLLSYLLFFDNLVNASLDELIFSLIEPFISDGE